MSLQRRLKAGKSLRSVLGAAKQKAALRDFEVTITETLEMTVRVKAKDQAEAERVVTEDWKNGKYVLDAGNFTGVEITAAPVIPERARSNIGKEGFEL